MQKKIKNSTLAWPLFLEHSAVGNKNIHLYAKTQLWETLLKYLYSPATETVQASNRHHYLGVRKIFWH